MTKTRVRAPRSWLMRSILAGLPLLAVVLLGNCGGEPVAENSQSDRRREQYFERQAEAVARAVEEGRLGPSGDVLAEMEAAAKEETIVDEETFEETVPRFFSPDGRILPWQEMDEDQQDALIAWINKSARVQAVVGDEFTRIYNELKLGPTRD